MLAEADWQVDAESEEERLNVGHGDCWPVSDLGFSNEIDKWLHQGKKNDGEWRELEDAVRLGYLG